jgi:hypothetical protein
MPDGKVWAIWKSGRNTTNGRFDIYASVRSGGTWSSPYNVGSAYYWETDPVLGLDRNDRPVAVWSLFTDAYYYNLYYSVWNGSSWSAAQQISDDCSSDLKASLCRDSSGTLWCFWYSRRSLDADIFCATFNGTSWSGATNLTQDTFPEYHPAAAATSRASVWVAYTKYRDGASEIWARHWNGSIWSETGPVSGTQTRAYRPTITKVSGNPMVCWQSFDVGNGDICYSVFDGSNWSQPYPVDADAGLDVYPSLATDAWDSQYLVWMSARNGNWDVYCSRYMSGWFTPWALETGTGPDINPCVVANSTGDVFAAWQNLTAGNWEINAKVWQTTGVAEGRVGQTPVLSLSPNPVRSSADLRLDIGARGRPAVLSVFDASGRLVRSQPVSAASAVLSVSDLASGVYVVRLTTDKGTSERSFLHLR